MRVARTIRPEPLARPAAIAMAHVIGQSGVLKLFSSMYLCKPSRKAIGDWTYFLSDKPADYLADLKLAVDAIGVNSCGIEEALLWDYTRLFIGPYKLPCPPWESVYRSQGRLMMQDAADDARRTYAAFGLSVDETGIMPDHIGVELNFLALVYELAGEENRKQSDCMRIRETFLNDHLLQWVPQFTTDMEAAAESHFYKSLARTTKATLALLSA